MMTDVVLSVAECMLCNFFPHEAPLMTCIVETCKNKLASNDKLRSHVDWLTEVTFRLTEKYTAKQPMKDASMKNVYRLRKVGPALSSRSGNVSLTRLQWKKDATRYIDREWTDQERVAFENGIAQNGPELRSVRDEVGTRDIFEVVRFYGHWKKCVFAASGGVLPFELTCLPANVWAWSGRCRGTDSLPRTATLT